MKTRLISLSKIITAIQRARWPVISVAITYFLSVLTGLLLVQAGVPFALDARDRIVGQAFNGSNETINALHSGHRFEAALLDFSGNLFLGAVPSTLGGLGIVFPYPLAAFRGWVGGVVSVDGNHVSRLVDPGEAVYYLVTLILQLIPYSLAGGAGVYLGLEYYRGQKSPQPAKWYVLPRQALADVAHIYLLIVPMFFIASLWEFFLR